MWLVVLLSIFVNCAVFADVQLRTKVYDIDHGHDGEETLILLTSGHVARLKPTKNKTQNNFEQIKKAQQWLDVTLNAKNEIERFTVTAAASDLSGKANLVQPLPNEDYVPTVIPSMEEARAIFRQARYVNKDSQCFNRAHIWSYEWFVNNNVNSNKTWIFFTRRYIRKFKFEWWFHVAPSVRVMEDGIVKEKVMDVKYSRGPLNLKNWTDIFMRDDAVCPRVETYSDYANYPESGTCFYMRSSMYYYQPVDIESQETWGTMKPNWYDTEVKAAYLEAFDEVI
ncbi:MAG: hypothetical protein H0V66_11275 [Bdellovibrionales bacterium]|nr:hypothetical protein [Bdellovibrionales bacterium]